MYRCTACAGLAGWRRKMIAVDVRPLSPSSMNVNPPFPLTSCSHPVICKKNGRACFVLALFSFVRPTSALQ